MLLLSLSITVCLLDVSNDRISFEFVVVLVSGRTAGAGHKNFRPDFLSGFKVRDVRDGPVP